MPPANQPSVCVSIVHYSAPELLERCLASFMSHSPTLSYRVVVADNSARQKSVRDLVGRFPFATLLEMPENLGFSAANNRAVQGASETFLFFLNPDTEIEEGTLETLVGGMETGPDLGAIGPANIDPDGQIQFSCRAFPGYKTFLTHRYSLLTRWFPNNPFSSEYLQSDWDHGERRDVDWISGAAMLVRREDFEAIGGFDEAFFLYAEDVDLCYRLHQMGRKIAYEPAAKVLHLVGGCSRRNRFRALWERHRSMYTFYRKHYSLEIPVIDFTTLLGISLRGAYFLILEALGRSPHR
jgi:hypothetical protein